MIMALSSNSDTPSKNNSAPDLFRRTEEGLEKSCGKPIALPANQQEIGGELIAILSKGLYTNPLDCLRDTRKTRLTPKLAQSPLKLQATQW